MPAMTPIGVNPRKIWPTTGVDVGDIIPVEGPGWRSFND